MNDETQFDDALETDDMTDDGLGDGAKKATTSPSIDVAIDGIT